MINFIYSISDMNLLLLINALGLFITFLSIFILKKWLPTISDRDKNLIASSTVTIVSTLIAIILGFILFFVFNNFSEAEDTVSQEANEVASIYHYSLLLDPTSKTLIKTTLQQYLNEVIQSEWPALRTAKTIDIKSYVIINDLFVKINHLRTEGKKEDSFIYEELYKNVSSLYKAHEDRLQMQEAPVEEEVWIVLAILTVLTLVLNCFVIIDFWIYIVISVLVSLIISSVIYLIIIFDHPFRGNFSVQPDPLQKVLVMISK